VIARASAVPAAIPPPTRASLSPYLLQPIWRHLGLQAESRYGARPLGDCVILIDLIPTHSEPVQEPPRLTIINGLPPAKVTRPRCRKPNASSVWVPARS
jgi:hypothetical protein